MANIGAYFLPSPAGYVVQMVVEGSPAQAADLRKGDVITAADALTGMLLAGILRRPLTESTYGNARYVETCVELFLKGIEA